MVETANRTLARKGYAPDEARVEAAAAIGPNHATLRGALLAREETDLVVRLLPVIEWLPERDDLVELTGKAQAR